MRTIRTIKAAALAGLLAACGGSQPPSTATPSDTPAMTDAQHNVAHFRTADGLYGFVLDRSGENAKLQVDGEKDIIELTQKEERSKSGELSGYRLVDPANAVRLLISVNGSISYLRGKDELPVTPDKEASPLGAATVVGPPVEKARTPAAYEKLAADLQSISVRAKFPEQKPEDSANLAKIEAVFAKADVSMFVRYKKPSQSGWAGRAEVVPSNFSGIGYAGGDFATDDDEANRHKLALKHGMKLIGISSAESDVGNHMLVRRSDKRDELADKTPGLVWEVDGSRVVFITFDGARYVVDLNQSSANDVPIERGAGPQASWPAPLQDTYADITYVSSLVKAGAHPQRTVDELEAVDKEWNDCVAKAWKPKRIAKDVSYRAEAVKIHKGCRTVLDKLETTLVKFIDERAIARTALHEKAVARAKQVGAAK